MGSGWTTTDDEIGHGAVDASSSASIAVLTRLGLSTETVANFLRELRKSAPEKLAKLACLRFIC